MGNMGVHQMIKELERLNPKAKFVLCDLRKSPMVVIYGNIDVANLKIPAGYHYKKGVGITNETLDALTTYESFLYIRDDCRINLSEKR